MRSAHLLRPRPWVPLLGLCLAFFTGAAAAVQTCQYDSIPASAPGSRFTDNLDGTVTDKVTGLQWKRCSEGQTWSGSTCTGTSAGHTWQAALLLAAAASDAGWSDWRLPNLKELASIVEQACYDPAIDLAVFPATSSSNYWSSSPATYYPDSAWLVHFFDGYDGFFFKNRGYLVRLVRWGH